MNEISSVSDKSLPLTQHRPTPILIELFEANTIELA